MKIQNPKSKIQKNVSLKNYTTFRIGGPAKYFFVAKAKENLIGAIKMAKKMKLPFFVLGGGSNILVSDKGFNGLVIKLQITNYKLQTNSKKQIPKIYAEAGTPLALVVSEATKKNLTGLEWAAGIPGTVGGAIYGNAGAFGSSMANVIKKVEVLDVKDLKFKNYDLKDCEFGYRDSIFKKNKNLIILSATLQLKEGKKEEIEKKIQENLKSRKEKQPLNFPSAGSIFKNPKGFSAGELIERCNLKGKRVGNVKISEKHANFIVNLGRGKAKDVMKLIKIIKNRVKKKFGVTLEEEIELL